MFEPMKNFVLMTCLGLASVWPNVVAAQEAPAPDMAGEVPLIEVPVIEAPLTPLTPTPYGSGDGGDTVSGTQNGMAALQAKITELEQRMTADRTLMMRQQMTRLRTIDERLEEMAVQIGELGIRPTGEAGNINTSIPAPTQTDDAFADPAKAAGIRLRLSTIEENLRQVSGQTAELVQSLDKLMQQVETVRQDNEFRFQQIEGSLGRAARDPDAMPSEAPEVLGQIRMATPVEKLDAPVSEGDASVALIGEGDLPMQNSSAPKPPSGHRSMIPKTFMSALWQICARAHMPVRKPILSKCWCVFRLTNSRAMRNIGWAKPFMCAVSSSRRQKRFWQAIRPISKAPKPLTAFLNWA